MRWLKAWVFLLLIMISCTSLAILWLVDLFPPSDFIPPGGVLHGAGLTSTSGVNADASLSDADWLFLVLDGRRRPDDVPAHLTCQAWERYLEHPHIKRYQELRNVPTDCLTDDFLQRVIGREPLSVIWYLPNELINEQLLISTLNSWSTKIKVIKGFETDISRVIPKSHWSRPVIDHYFAVGGWNLENIPTEMIDYGVARRAVEVNGLNLKYVPDYVLLDSSGEGREQLWRAAITDNPAALQFVPWEERRANDCVLSWFALEKSNTALSHVPAICFRGSMPPP